MDQDRNYNQNFTFGKPPVRKHSNFEDFEDELWFTILQSCFQTVIGTFWWVLMAATVLTLVRMIRAHFKIGWTLGDQKQMYDYMTPDFIGRVTFFAVMQVCMTFIWTQIEFTQGCLYYGFFGAVTAGVIYYVNEYRSNARHRIRIRNLEKAMYQSVSQDDSKHE